MTAILGQSNLNYLPSDMGLLGWSYDPVVAANNSQQLTGGKLVSTQIKVPACTVTNVWVATGTAGASLTAGQNFIGLYSAAGALLSGSADQTTNWQTGFTLTKVPLTTPQAVPGGYVYVCWYAVGTTIPFFQCNGASGIVTGNLASVFRFATGPTGLTTALPANLTQAAAGAPFWAAVS